jgi:hypothetical protein
MFDFPLKGLHPKESFDVAEKNSKFASTSKLIYNAGNTVMFTESGPTLLKKCATSFLSRIDLQIQNRFADFGVSGKIFD